MTYNVPKKVNVPELMYSRFLKNIPFVEGDTATAKDTLLAKLDGVSPTRRGRGYSRWLHGDNALTRDEWNALYQLAAEAREQMKGAEDREVTLRAAICARALAERMENIGVEEPVIYTPKFRTTRKAKTEEVVDATPETPDTDLSSVIPPVPPVVDQTADVEEAGDDDLDYIHGDIASQ